MNKKWDSVLIGRACIDFLARVEKYPTEDSKVKVSDWQQVGGGQASTGACLISSLGGKVSFIGRLGNDPEGDIAIAEMEKYGVDCSFVKRDANFTTPKAFIAINKNTSSRTIFYESAIGPGLKKQDLPMFEILNSKTVLIDPQEIQIATEIIDKLKENNCYTILDAERVKEGLEILVPKVDALIVSRSCVEERYPQMKYEDALLKLYEERSALTAITLGEQGAIAIYKNQFISVPSLDVDVLDTTGAGDNFHAAFAFAIGRDRDIPEALAYASAVASLTCLGIGGRSGFPSEQESLKGFKEVVTKMKFSAVK